MWRATNVDSGRLWRRCGRTRCEVRSATSRILRRRLAGHERMMGLMLALMPAGYYGFYLASPQDLGWHLDNSLVRLLL